MVQNLGVMAEEGGGARLVRVWKPGEGWTCREQIDISGSD